MSSGLQRILIKAQTWGRDSFQLASAMIRCVPLLRSSSSNNNSVRDVLVQYARSSNTAAVSLLHVDREVGLLRYWGVSGYLRQKKVGWNWELTRRWFYQNSITEQQQQQPMSEQSKLTTKKQAPTARVAFMVTSAMRQELTERLAYSEEHIKRLTPLQASLILQHDVPFHQVSSKLPELEQQHFEMQEAANQSAATIISTEVLEEDRLDNKPLEQEANEDREGEVVDESNSSANSKDVTLTIPAVAVTTHSEQQHPEESRLASSSSSTSSRFKKESDVEQLLPMSESIPREQSSIVFIDSIMDADAANASPDKIWYELVEHDSSDRESSVVGLYRDVMEAQLALETRQLFERRRAKDKHTPVTTSFVLTRVLR